MQRQSAIRTVHQAFFRHDRYYCIFSVNDRVEDFLWYSHMSRPLRSLMFGRDFLSRLPELRENDDLCIECGLGPAVAGGVALDDGDQIAWNCTIMEANQILGNLRKHCIGEQSMIIPFDEKQESA
jgi:hypothetical protein